LKGTAVEELDGTSLFVDVAEALELLETDADALAGILLAEDVDKMLPATWLPFVSTVLLDTLADADEEAVGTNELVDSALV